jgi:hypothetical protein
LERKQKRNERTNDLVEIRFIPLPAEKREEYQQSIRLIAKILIEIANEDVLSKIGSSPPIGGATERQNNEKENPPLQTMLQ